MCNLVMDISPCHICIEWLLPLLSAVSQPSLLYGGVYSLGGSAESHLIPPPSLQDGEGSSLPGLVPSDATVKSESVMGIKPGDSSVVIGYQVDELPAPTFILVLLVR